MAPNSTRAESFADVDVGMRRSISPLNVDSMISPLKGRVTVPFMLPSSTLTVAAPKMSEKRTFPFATSTKRELSMSETVTCPLTWVASTARSMGTVIR